jgi:hypothetical protein
MMCDQPRCEARSPRREDDEAQTKDTRINKEKVAATAAPAMQVCAPLVSGGQRLQKTKAPAWQVFG